MGSKNHDFGHPLCQATRHHSGGRRSAPKCAEMHRRNLWRCKGCKRTFMPFCNGAADDMPEHCDDCWAAAHPTLPTESEADRG